MSYEVTPDNARDMQESIERHEEAEARQFEALKAKGGTTYAEHVFDEREKKRQERIKRGERELEQQERGGDGPHLETLKNGKKILVMHE